MSIIGDVIVETADARRDLVRSSISWASLSTNLESLQLTGAANAADAGNSPAITLIGNTGNNLLNGMSGEDKINGGTGNDDIKGSACHDTLTGGPGKDHFVFCKRERRR